MKQGQKQNIKTDKAYFSFTYSCKLDIFNRKNIVTLFLIFQILSEEKRLNKICLLNDENFIIKVIE